MSPKSVKHKRRDNHTTGKLVRTSFGQYRIFSRDRFEVYLRAQYRRERYEQAVEDQLEDIFETEPRVAPEDIPLPEPVAFVWERDIRRVESSRPVIRDGRLMLYMSRV